MTEEKSKKIRDLTTWRKLLAILVDNTPDIKDIQLAKPDGDVYFSVDLEGQGITSSVFIKNRQVLFSPFIANFMGELLVRENIEQFVPLITGLDGEQYMSIVNRYEHNRFGMHVEKSKLIFTFHVSLLQNILTEDFKRKVKNES